MVNVPVLLSVVGTTPRTVNELAAMLVIPVPVEKPKAPELIVIAPSCVAPTLLEKVTVPVAFAVRVRCCIPGVSPVIIPPKAIEPPGKPLVSTVKGIVLWRVVSTVPATVNELAMMLVTPVPMESPPPPAPMVKAPRGVDPTL
jgi:hypothetical protein